MLSFLFNSPASTSLETRLKSNNFDLLRFLFAFVVFLVHAHLLSDAEPLSIFSELVSSGIAVKCFFVVSGFLIFMSYEKSHSTRHYLVKRIRRIYPAYFFVVVAFAFIGGLLSTYSMADYFSLGFVKYLAANLLFLGFLQANLPGLFESNTLHAVNGALWSLKIEVMFYVFVPLAVMTFRKWGKLPLLLTLYVLSSIFWMAMTYLTEKTGSGVYRELQVQLPGQLTYFIAGAMAYYYLATFVKYATALVIFALFAVACQSWLPWVAIEPLVLAILVVYAACVIPPLGNFDKYGDFSYGIYIVHFPILQIMVGYHLFQPNPWVGLLLATILVLLSSFLLWHFIEKPFLRKSSHYVASNHG
ncbi:MAG: acyltransferase [Gallionella sp.]|nr:acyltransferase [Gallionella sp.]MDD4957808.1 acyltransferase [Gallionella sp.]